MLWASPANAHLGVPSARADGHLLFSDLGDGGAFLPPRFLFTRYSLSAVRARHFAAHWSGIYLCKNLIMEEKCVNDLQS